MNNINNTAFEDEAKRRMTELYDYCAAYEIPMICNMLFERTVQADGSFDQRDWQAVRGEFEDMNPAMQAFSIVSQLPPDAQLMAVQILIKVMETAEEDEILKSIITLDDDEVDAILRPDRHQNKAPQLVL
jgi:hypothetical protein